VGPPRAVLDAVVKRKIKGELSCKLVVVEYFFFLIWILFLFLCITVPCAATHLVVFVLVTYVLVIVEANFDAGVGFGR
jgi:hypothetical protein